MTQAAEEAGSLPDAAWPFLRDATSGRDVSPEQDISLEREVSPEQNVSLEQDTPRRDASLEREVSPVCAISPINKNESVEEQISGSVSVDGWPTEPQPLERSIGMRLLRASFGVFGILASIPFLVLAGVAFDRIDKEVDQKDWDRVQRAMSAVGFQFRDLIFVC
ncbi:hypothetical protein BDV59DRAFT_180852 [Aspergillus ambiguus]|uniref:uncharacterized protein n=1 Tax=Aspergillus ambiguus TaxID=176160 RepID=UPI003CCD2501